MVQLARLHPDAPLLVMTHLGSSECGFTNGKALRKNWAAQNTYRVGPGSPIPEGWTVVVCPDESRRLIKFLSASVRLLDDSADTSRITEGDTMPKPAPPKKGAAKPAKVAAAPKSPKPAKASDGSYPWLLNRVCTAIVAEAPDDKAKELRAALKDAPDFLHAIALAQKAGVIGEEPAAVFKFVNGFVAAGVTVPGGKK